MLNFHVSVQHQDQEIFHLFPDFWTVYGECENFTVLKGHTGAVMDLEFSTDGG